MSNDLIELDTAELDAVAAGAFIVSHNNVALVFATQENVSALNGNAASLFGFAKGGATLQVNSINIRQ